MKPDRAADPAGVRVRRLISVSANGNVPPAKPNSPVQSAGQEAGASSMPA